MPNKAVIPPAIQIAATAMTDQAFSEILPISQKTVVLSCSLFAIEIRNIMTAERKAFTTTPARRRLVTCDLPANLPIYQTSRIVRIAPTNAKSAIGEPAQMVIVSPEITAIIVPNAAPLDIPSIYGSANGFRKSA